MAVHRSEAQRRATIEGPGLGLNTTRSQMEAEYRAGHGSLRVPLRSDLSSSDLMTLARRHTRRRYTDALLQLIVIHPHASNRVLSGVFSLGKSNPGVLNAIATSGRASRHLLTKLRRSKWSSVREHASLALEAG